MVHTVTLGWAMTIYNSQNTRYRLPKSSGAPPSGQRGMKRPRPANDHGTPRAPYNNLHRLNILQHRLQFTQYSQTLRHDQGNKIYLAIRHKLRSARTT